MYFFSKKSSRKVVHHSNCRYCLKLESENKGHFATLEEANAVGYRLCNCCAPIAKYVRRDVKIMQSFCLEKGLLYYLYNGSITVETKHSKWKIIVAGKRHSIFLYHKNKFEPGEGGIVPGYHSQSVRRNSVMEYLEYIAAHEDYRYRNPLKAGRYTAANLPQAASIPAQTAAVLQQTKPTPPQKGTKRWKKEQARKKREEEHMQIRRVLSLIEQVSAM